MLREHCHRERSGSAGERGDPDGIASHTLAMTPILLVNMDNKEIAEMMRHVAAAYILKDENKFRFQIIAYQKAADSIENEIKDLKGLWKENKLGEVPGIGKTIAGYLEELFTTGKIAHFETLFKTIPSQVFVLMQIPGMGPKRASKLVLSLNLSQSVNPIAHLLKLALQHKIAKIEGFGDKSEAEIIKNIESLSKGQSKEKRIILPIAFEIAQDIISYLKKESSVLQIEPLGSLRRMASTVHDIDIAVASNEPQKVLDYFISYPQTGRIIEKGDNTSSIVTKTGDQIDLMVQPPKGFGALLQHFTGSKQHNIRLREHALRNGLSLSEYGIRTLKKVQSSRLQLPSAIADGGQAKFKVQSFNSKLKVYQFSSEEDFYKALDLPWIPPELREDKGEIEAAIADKLPLLVNTKDIKGDFHIHSNYNLEPSHDLGTASLEDIFTRAVKLGYEYIAISDHSPSISKHNSQQIIDILKRRKEYIEQHYNLWKQKSENSKLKVIVSLEIDILSSGAISVPEKGFDYLDMAISSIHSRFDMNKKDMTKRIINGMDNRKIKILGHPTGRLLGERNGYEIDIEKILDYCQKNKKALEINSYPTRLDLPDFYVREAVKKGVKMCIDTDSHNISQMDNMFYGMSVAKRGWAKPSDIINTMGYNKIEEWISR